MTASTTSSTRQDVLTARLHELYAEREQARRELVSDSSGDAADRATNVDANVRFAMLQQRIADLEVELSVGELPRSGGSGVSVGDVVTVDFGDGPETFLYASVEQAVGGLEVITPGSPFGKALRGAASGSTVTYTTAARRSMTVTVVAVS